MDANDLIAYNAVNRLEDFSIRGSSFPTRYTTRNFGSFCPRLTCERRLLRQGVDFFTPHFVSMGRFASIGGRIVWQTTSFGTVRDCVTNRSLPRLALDQNEPPRLVTEEKGREKQWGFIARTL